MLYLRILLRQSAYHYGDHDHQFSLVVVRIERAYRRFFACDSVSSGIAVGAQMDHSGAFPGSQFRAAAPGLDSNCSARSGSAHHGPGEDEPGAGKRRPIIAGRRGRAWPGLWLPGGGSLRLSGACAGRRSGLPSNPFGRLPGWAGP
jgi:hypothetical protein